ncbi:MAG: hypothetical protein PHY73_07250 [Candidatus Omnitrophica bacterium]|nr:hypothetical protein [Candidatus Omnitrophota bacterium]
MNKNFKEKTFGVFAILTIACLGIAILSSQKFSTAKEDLNEERYQRMVAEEKLEKAKGKNRVLEGKSVEMQEELDRLNALLNEEKGAIADLKKELEKTMRFNQVLQNELKNALVTDNSTSETR